LVNITSSNRLYKNTLNAYRLEKNNNIRL